MTRRVLRALRAAEVTAAFGALFAMAAPARAQLALEGRISLGSEGIRLHSQLPSENPTEFSGAATGFDAFVFAPGKRLGFAIARMAASSSPANAGKYSALSIVGLYGRPDRAAEVGFGRRTGYSDRSHRDLDATYSFLRLGGRLSAPMGTMGFSVGARGSLYAPMGGGSRHGATGYDAGTHVRWTSDRYPLTAALEYRSERFSVERDAHQELSTVTLSVGYAFRRGP